MRSSMQACDKVTHFHATEAYSILGVTKVRYSVSRPCSNEMDEITVPINTKSLTAWETILSTFLYVLLTVDLSMILVINQLNAQNLVL